MGNLSRHERTCKCEIVRMSERRGSRVASVVPLRTLASVHAGISHTLRGYGWPLFYHKSAARRRLTHAHTRSAARRKSSAVREHPCRSTEDGARPHGGRPGARARTWEEQRLVGMIMATCSVACPYARLVSVHAGSIANAPSTSSTATTCAAAVTAGVCRAKGAPERSSSVPPALSAAVAVVAA